MPTRDPQYVRLIDRLSRGLCSDVLGGSGWSISGLAVKEFPDPEDDPEAANFVRDRVRAGVLEEASRGEFEEYQELAGEGAPPEPSEDARSFVHAVQAVVQGKGFGHNERNAQRSARRMSRALAKRRAEEPSEVEEEDPNYTGYRQTSLHEEPRGAASPQRRTARLIDEQEEEPTKQRRGKRASRKDEEETQPAPS